MRKLLVSASFVVLCLTSLNSVGQTLSAGAATTRHPLDASQFPGMVSGPITASHLAFNKLSASTNAAVQGKAASQPIVLRSVPNFTSSFTFQGATFPFTMVGRDPHKGGTTRVDTSYLALSFFFDEFVDSNGNNITIDATVNTATILNGPDFQSASFTTGNTQFADAVQRAEFASVIDKDRDGDGSWHTLLEQPRQFTPVTVEVPVGSSLVFQDSNGTFLALIDFGFMVSQLNTLVQVEPINVTEIPIFVTRNAVYGSFTGNKITSCCVGGFHTAFETQQVGNTVFVQTFDFATSLDPDVAAFVFGDPTAFADVDPLSHEISETFNDPFVDNIVPRYEEPGLPFIACSSVLETGDPVENLPNATFPVTVNGFTYHPQTEALLEWFSRETPSSAFGGAYSYPGNNLTTPSTACPAGH